MYCKQLCALVLVALAAISNGEGLSSDPGSDICDIAGVCGVNERCLVSDGAVQCIPLSFCETESCGKGFICNEDYVSMTFNCSCEAGKALVDDQCVPFCELDVCLEGMVCVQHATSFDCVCPEKFIMSGEGECVPLCQTSPCPDNMECLLQKNNTFSCLCKDGFLLTEEVDEIGSTIETCERYCSAASCPDDMACVEHLDSFSCLCPEGTSMSPSEICVADCLSTGCEEGLECRKRGSKHGCYCTSGHFLQDKVCTPMCATDPCPAHMDCLLQNDTFSCICKDGELMDPGTGDCVEICGLAPCPSTMDCLVHNETYSCVCRDGEMLDDSGVCVPYCDTNPCPDHLFCAPHSNSYSCICPDNGVLIKDQCTSVCDVRQCDGACTTGREEGSVWYGCQGTCSDNPCYENEVCTESGKKSSYRCSCEAGFAMVEGLCQDVDECQSNVCKGGMECTNTPGSYVCACPEGTLWDLEQCEDVNECLTNPCPEALQCVDLKRSFACSCPPGYDRVGESCVDIDECVLLKDACLDGMTCQNVPGSFRCTCPMGYYAGVKGECLDIDECAMRDVCNAEDVCINTPGSFRCDCADASCESDASCVNSCDAHTEYCRDKVCRCRHGYILKRGKCVSRCGFGLCGGRKTLCDVESTEACSCQPGYVSYSSAYVAPCVDRNECLELMPCGVNERCMNTPGGYKCQCETGYFLNNAVCSDVADAPYAHIKIVSPNVFSIGETATIITRIRTTLGKGPSWTNVGWSKGHTSLSPPPQRYTTPYNRQVLVIEDFSPEDAGNYTLTVEKKGYLTTTATIPVYVRPLIAKIRSPSQYGQWTKLEVKVSFMGPFEVEWYRVSRSRKQLLLPSSNVTFARRHQTIQIRNNQGVLYQARVVGVLGDRMFVGTETFEV